MAQFRFNKPFKDKEQERDVKANEVVEMTIKRADEIVENVKKQAKENDRFKDWLDFSYERVDNKEEKSKEADK